MLLIPLINSITTLFLMMCLGYLVVKCGLLRSQDSKVLTVLCIYIIMPCVNINAFQIHFTIDVLQGFLVAVGLSVLIHLLLFVLDNLLKRKLHMTATERFSIIYPNAGNLVIPIVSSLFGSEWVIYASAYMSVQLFFLWTHAQSVMRGQDYFSFRKIMGV